MKIKIMELKDDSMRFLIEDSTPSFVNMLRRTLLNDVPKMAIEDVEFHLGPIRHEGNDYESISPLFDEIIAHRLGMLPIPTDLDLFTFMDKCKCGGVGCPSCTIKYMINKTGPCTIYSRDLEVVKGWLPGDEKLMEDKFKIKDENIPIVKLTDRQALMIYATAQLGTGKKHAKWQAVSGVGYKYYPEIKINTEKCDGCGRCVKSCPKNILAFKGKKVEIKDIEKCSLCSSCEEICPSGAIKVKGDDSKFIFRFETDGSMTARSAMGAALKTLGEKCREFEEKIKEI
ncbi:MAG: DNA-directed RNA polymerase subunit D [Thermoplasmatales archaeon]|nr:DNA-directed RNA polymerase subunit D [Thermoplasmatales archaeon]